MRSFADVRREFEWNPIAGCPGRFVLAVALPHTDPVDIAGPGAKATHLSGAKCRDAVVLVPLNDGGGLLSYRRTNGTYLHTLNDPSGLERKLRQLGF